MKKLFLLLFLFPIALFGQQVNLSSGLIANELSGNNNFYCDGQYSADTDFSKYVNDLNFNEFTISMDFKTADQRRQWVFVLSRGWRLIGFLINKDNSVSLTANNQDVYKNTNANITLNQWHNATITFKNGTATIFLDGKRIGSESFSFPSGFSKTDKSISTTNYSNGTSFKGDVRNFKVYSRAVNQAEVTKLAGKTAVNTNRTQTGGNTVAKGIIADEIKNQDGFYCDGQYSADTDYSSFVNNFDFTNFTISVDFKTSEQRRQWVFVLGGGWRLIGFLINKDNSVSLTANNQDVYINTTSEIALDQWHTATISYANNTAKIFMDGKKIGSQVIAFSDGFSQYDKDISTTNYSNGTAFKGYIRNFKVYNRALKLPEIQKLAGKTATEDNAPPQIKITYPKIARGFKPVEESKLVTVKGVVADKSGIFEVTVNGIEARVAANGAFQASVPLAYGDNTIKVRALDIKQNAAEKEFLIERKAADFSDNTSSNAIVWQNPKSKNTVASSENYNIQACINTDATISEINISNNGQKIKTVKSGAVAFRGSDCKNSINENISLQNGANKIRIEAITSSGTHQSSVTIKLDGNASKYYALIIGVDDYQDNSIIDLDKPVGDAQKLYNVLSGSYSFNSQDIKFLRNPSKNDIIKALDFYFDNTTEEDNLLIFYAGHGYWDDKFEQGYWLPSDAAKDNRGTWLSNGTLRDYLRAIPAKHSLLITDACFGGGIFKSRGAFSNASVAVNQLVKLPSRKAMTSGALSEVPDNSVFIEYLVKRLEQNTEKFLSSEQLFASFKIAVINNSENGQVPQFGEVKGAGDEGGDFIFIRK